MPRKLVSLPDPLIFRKRKFAKTRLSKTQKLDKTPYLMVPRFFDLYHPVTNWLINTIVTQNEKELDRVLTDKKINGLLKFEPDPAAIQPQCTVLNPSQEFIITKGKYFQILDRPEIYDSENFSGPLFHRHAVLYLTPLGLAIYLRKTKAAKKLLECLDRDTSKKLVLARQPQFVTCVNDRFGDIMGMYDHNLAMLCETFDILHLMLVNDNWFPMESFKLVYRKQHVATTSKFDDYMDYAFYLLLTKRGSLCLARLCEALLRLPSEHFVPNYMSQPSRATKFTLVRDAGRVVNNCKTYPRRLLRCAFYADKTLKSTLNLLRAAEAFVQFGIFRLAGDPILPFCTKHGNRRRLELLPQYKPRSRDPYIIWPSQLYELDSDCCIALLCALMYKLFRMKKVAPFQTALQLAMKLFTDAGWLNHFSRISDQELRDYFMGLDDAEKLHVRPMVLTYVREFAKVSVMENRFNLCQFFTDERIEENIKSDADLMNNDILCGMVQCEIGSVMNYFGKLTKGDKLKQEGSVIGGNRTRDEGRDDPRNRYYMDRPKFPPESIKTVMINTANVEAWSESTSAEASAEAAINCSNYSRARTSDSRRQGTLEFDELPQLVSDSCSGTVTAIETPLTVTPFQLSTSASDGMSSKPSRLPVFQWRSFKMQRKL